MALNHSPKIITDGLVFAYDMANTKKSWKGSPTTNLFGTNLVATNATKQIPNGQFSGTYNGWTATGVANDNPRVVLFNGSITVIPSTFYTLSCLYWSSNNIVGDVYLKFSDTGWTESTYYIQPFTSQSVSRSGSFSTTDLGGGWKYCVGSFQTLPTTTTLQQLFFDVDVAGVIVFVTNFQLEQQTFSTPFVAGTRSNTQAIVDLVGQNTVTASSLTYNSNGTFGFNGSSNYFDTGKDLSWNNLDKASLTFILKPSNLTMGNSGFAGKMNPDWEWAFYQSGTNLSMVYWNTGGGHSNGMDWTATNFFTSTSQYVVFQYVWDGSTSYVYRNGELFLTKTATDPSINQNRSNNIVIGGHTHVWGDSYWNGTIQVACFYNRALTPAEVKQNFNALRGRYGI